MARLTKHEREKSFWMPISSSISINHVGRDTEIVSVFWLRRVIYAASENSAIALRTLSMSKSQSDSVRSRPIVLPFLENRIARFLLTVRCPLRYPDKESEDMPKTSAMFFNDPYGSRFISNLPFFERNYLYLKALSRKNFHKMKESIQTLEFIKLSNFDRIVYYGK